MLIPGTDSVPIWTFKLKYFIKIGVLGVPFPCKTTKLPRQVQRKLFVTEYTFSRRVAKVSTGTKKYGI